jgi:hypothetical protein
MGKHEIIEARNVGLESVPDDIIGIVGKPALLPTEDPSEYDALLLQLARAVGPSDIVEWIWISDLASLVWEMRRLRDLRERLVENHTAEGLDELFHEDLDDIVKYLENEEVKQRVIADWKSNDPFRREVVDRLLRKKGFDLSNVYAAVFEQRLDEIAKLESLIASLGRRRDSVLREIERRREAVGRRLRDVTDGDFKVKQSGSRSPGE